MTTKQYYHHLARHFGGRINPAAEAAAAEAVQALHRRRICGTAATVKVVRHRKVEPDIATAIQLHQQRPAGTGVLSLRKQVAA